MIQTYKDWYLYRPYENRIDPFIKSCDNAWKLLMYAVYLYNIVNYCSIPYGNRIRLRAERIFSIFKDYKVGQLNFDGITLQEVMELNRHVVINADKKGLNYISVMTFVLLDRAYKTEDEMLKRDITNSDVDNMRLAVRSLNKSIVSNDFETSMAYVILGKHLFEIIYSRNNKLPHVDANNLQNLDYYLNEIESYYNVNLVNELSTFNKMIQTTIANRLKNNAIKEFKELYTRNKYDLIFRTKEKRFGNLVSGRIDLSNGRKEALSFSDTDSLNYKQFETLLDEYIERVAKHRIGLSKFLEEKGISINQFNNARKLVEENNLLVDKLTDLDKAMEDNSAKSLVAIISVVERNIEDIRNGVTYLEYIKRGYKLSKLEELIKTELVRKRVDSRSLLEVRKFININKGKDNPVSYKEQMSLVYKNSAGEILYTNEMKQQVFDYMNSHNIPHTIGAFKGLLKELKDTGKISDARGRVEIPEE